MVIYADMDERCTHHMGAPQVYMQVVWKTHRFNFLHARYSFCYRFFSRRT